MSKIGGESSQDRDDAFERVLREAREDAPVTAPIKEPSAAERARRPGLVARRRTARQARKARRTWRKTFGGGRSHERRRQIITWLVLIGIAGGLAALTQLHLRLPSLAGGNTNDRTPVTNGPVPTLASPGPPADPFAGSPAAAYADGTAGIVPPRPHAVGGFSAGQVAAAYATVRNLLRAAYLDPATLNGGSPDAFAQLLIPSQRTDFVHGLDDVGLTKAGYQRSTRVDVVSFAHGTTTLIGRVIKVHGFMSAGATEDAGREVLQIRSDFVFVYPVQRPGQPANWVRVVARNYSIVEFYTWDDPGGALEPWLYDWPGDGVSQARCDVNDGYVHPEFPSGPPDSVRPSGKPLDPYDLNTPRFRGVGCQQTTGT